MTEVKITVADAKQDLLNLVALNRSILVAEELSLWERWEQGGPWVDPDTLDLHLQVIGEAGGIVLVARTKNAILGEVELLFENLPSNTNQAIVAWIIVDSEHRNEGIGTLLLDYACRTARAKGCTQLTTFAGDDEAASFFHANGFSLSHHEGKFTKKLDRDSRFPIKASIQKIPLNWAPRQQVPMGFEPSLGINYSSQYIWTYLRNMDRLYTLLGTDISRPNLWLLRQENDEALTTDHQYVRIWLAETNHQVSNFLPIVLGVTESLSHSNGITQLTVFARENQYQLLEAHGYNCQETHPVLFKSI